MQKIERQFSPSPLGGFLALKTRERGMTLSDVADITETSISGVSKVFTGRVKNPGGRFTLNLAKHLDLTVQELLPYCEPECKAMALPRIEELSQYLPQDLISNLKTCIPTDPKLLPSFLKLLEGLRQTTSKQRQR